MSLLNKIKSLYTLTKPGVLYGNALTTVAGFFYASRGSVDWPLFLYTVFGSTLIIASACVINNYLDQDIDAVMERTKSRPLITGDVQPREALWLGVWLGIIGVWILVAFTNLLVVSLGVAGFIIYVWLYGALSKRRSIHGTIVGSISGAIPITAGYVAVSATLDVTALLLFLILFFWQFPEFYSIAIFRQKEYKNAAVPVITVIKGVPYTIHLIRGYTVIFALTTLLLGLYSHASITYTILMAILGLFWSWLALFGDIDRPNVWARQMFRVSLIVLLVFCALISVDNLLP